MERLQKVIANYGYTSRRKAEELIKKKKVMVNGKIITDLGVKVDANDIISIDGVIINKDIKHEYYILNKPREVISSVTDENGRITVTDLINTEARIYPIGRLDYDTTGLILLTNDGDFANVLMHPSYEIEKTYIAKVEGLVNNNEIKKLREGVLIEGKKTAKAKVHLKKYDKKTDKSLVEITIHEGKNHQIKKMFQAINHEVVKLKREKYANLDLRGLKSGMYRKLTNKEVAILYSLIK